MENQKSRREKRKEVRSAKKQEKHQALTQYKKSQCLKKKIGNSKSRSINNPKNSFSPSLNEKNDLQTNSSNERNLNSSQPTILKKDEDKLESSVCRDSTTSKKVKRQKDFQRNSKTKFEEYLELTRPYAGISAEEDLKLERKLAKKLKVKDGKLRGIDDGINLFFEGIGLDPLDGEEIEYAEDFRNSSSSKKHKKRKSSVQRPEDETATDKTVGSSELDETGGAEVAVEEASTITPSSKRHKKRKSLEVGREGNTVVGVSEPEEIPRTEFASKEFPANVVTLKGSEKYVAPNLRVHVRNESEEHAQIRRRVQGLLNRLCEYNVESVAEDLSKIFHSVSRSAGSQIISEETVASCSKLQNAAAFAALVAGMACSVGIDFSAKLMESLAKSFEDKYLKEGEGSLHNITLLLSYLCIFGVCSSDLMYDFLTTLSKQMSEIDVSTILTVLQCCGMKMRGDDPVAMKIFILNVQNRVNELKANPEDGQENIGGKRLWQMDFMLKTLGDIKNNRVSSKEDADQHTRIKKWLQKLRVEDIMIRGLKWSKLLDPEKKGQWWYSGHMVSTTDDVDEVASTIDKEVLEAQKMLQLAAAQRMNTDARKAIFCIIMSGEDYVDALEKLLRLDLSGKQDREIIRVLLECCLQEKVFNKYYTILASKLCEHDKNHKFTLQYCLWDHFKELESMQLIRSMNLARFVAEMIATFTLSLSVLKTVDMSDSSMLTPKRIMHLRMLFEAIFEYPDKLVWNIFTRVAITPELELLRNGFEFFIKEYVVKTNKALNGKFKIAKKALHNVEGVLM